MITPLHLLTLVGLAFALAPRTAPAPHPHYPMVTTVTAAQGKIALSWFTVPFNQEKLKEAVPNYVWSRGFSLETEVALRCGKVQVPAGKYSFGFQLDDKGKAWSVLLVPAELGGLQRQLRMAKRRGDDPAKVQAKITALSDKGIRSLLLPSDTFAGKHAEHMEIYAIQYGHTVASRRAGAAASGGIRGELRASFGDIHTSVAFTEVFGEDKAKQPKTPK